jgi:hypothetical protein
MTMALAANAGTGCADERECAPGYEWEDPSDPDNLSCVKTKSTNDDRVCDPGAQAACACVGGGQGAQICREDGSGWDPCDCGTTSSSASSSSGSGAGGGAGGSGAGGSGAGGSGGSVSPYAGCVDQCDSGQVFCWDLCSVSEEWRPPGWDNDCLSGPIQIVPACYFGDQKQNYVYRVFWCDLVTADGLSWWAWKAQTCSQSVKSGGDPWGAKCQQNDGHFALCTSHP